MSIYNDILSAKAKQEKLLAVLIDPDKFDINTTSQFADKINNSIISHLFVGGSSVEEKVTERLVLELKTVTSLPIVLFPGDVTQITKSADGLLFLSLLSGRNAEYLIGKQVVAVSLLKNTNLEVIPTGYILIESGTVTAVQRVTETKPLSPLNNQLVADTAKAAELLGMKLVYLEAGSGAKQAVPIEMISFVKKELSLPLIVGGGIRSKSQLENAYKAGADLVVIGTAFEENENFLSELN